jgi:hypothetical protein
MGANPDANSVTPIARTRPRSSYCFDCFGTEYLSTILRTLAYAVGLCTLTFAPLKLFCEAIPCVVRVPGLVASYGGVYSAQNTSAGILVGMDGGLFRYDGSGLIRVPGSESIGKTYVVQNTTNGIFVGGVNGLFHYDGTKFVLLPESKSVMGSIHAIQDTKAGLLAGTEIGLFRYDGSKFVLVPGSKVVGGVVAIQDTPIGLLVGSYLGLFRYNGSAFVLMEDNEKLHAVLAVKNTKFGPLVGTSDGLYRFDGSSFVRATTSKELVSVIQETNAGVLVGGFGGLYYYDNQNLVPVPGSFRLIWGTTTILETRLGILVGDRSGLFMAGRALSDAKVILENRKDLDGIAPTKLGIQVSLSVNHPCAAVAGAWGLKIVPIYDGQKLDPIPAEGLHRDGNTVSFHANVPFPAIGKWTFQVISSTLKEDVGRPPEPIKIVTPGFFSWLIMHWQALAESFGFLLAALNLLVLVAARYSPAAWRIATDGSWGKSVLLPQRLLLSHCRGAQLWILDLYVQRRRRKYSDQVTPFLALPLSNNDDRKVDSDSVLGRLASSRHVWIQGTAGMGKTAIFLHLRDIHFGGTEGNAFTIFRRDRYVLVPIEARRFPEAPFSEHKNASSWVVACVQSILSEGGLTFDDQSLLRAMLNKGTLAIAIDGINEVAREQAVYHFASEFEAAPLLITSQTSGELPFEVWRLPGSIYEHVYALLELYLGEKRAKELAIRLRNTGLLWHLRSGYDVRLIIELVESALEEPRLPEDRIGLYRTTVQVAAPIDEERLELLRAAAWKILSDREPNEEKRRMIPDQDLPGDLLAQLEAVRERERRSIRLIRLSPPGYEFVHDQMNSYLAACWFVRRPTVSIMCDLLDKSKIWHEGREAQFILWDFVAQMLDRTPLEDLWVFAGDDDRRSVLGGALAKRAEREGWTLTRSPGKAPKQNTNQRIAD